MKNSTLEQIKQIVTPYCERGDFPRMCEKIQTTAGLKYVANRIKYMNEKDGLTILQTLPHIENELDNL